MDKALLVFSMSNSITDPVTTIFFVCLCSVLSFLALIPACLFFGVKASMASFVLLCSATWIWYNFMYLPDGEAPIDKYVEFKDNATHKKWSGRRIPIAELYENYLEGKLTFRGDIFQILRDHRDEFVNYKLTFSVVRFLLLQLFPNTENSSFKSLQATKKEIADHYDRGNDWFESFLGPRMVYTCGLFYGLDQSLETAQDNKMSLICDKLMLREDENFLDIGCGWGTLACHAAKKYKAKSIGVTLSVEGAQYCRDTAKKQGLEGKVNILCMDYREIPKDQVFDKIASIEMAEHVGLSNFQLYLTKVSGFLRDDGMFLMQVAGIRQGPSWQDLAWGIFMSRYIFPGADASTPLHWYVRQLEIAGFEVHSVETIEGHYSETLYRWHLNFQKNRVEMEKKYGAALCRLWDFFLAWSVIASGQGSAACYQILCHKNTNKFPRKTFCDAKLAQNSVGLLMPSKS